MCFSVNWCDLKLSDSRDSREPGVTVKDVCAHDFIKAYADFLKKSGKIEVPAWADTVKTSTAKELSPYDEDWFYIRCASVARHVYVRSPVGVGSLKKIFGGRKRRGTRPSHFSASSGAIIRAAVQQLENIHVLEAHEEGGRIISSEGRQDLDRIAGELLEEEDEE